MGHTWSLTGHKISFLNPSVRVFFLGVCSSLRVLVAGSSLFERHFYKESLFNSLPAQRLHAEGHNTLPLFWHLTRTDLGSVPVVPNLCEAFIQANYGLTLEQMHYTGLNGWSHGIMTSTTWHMHSHDSEATFIPCLSSYLVWLETN